MLNRLLVLLTTAILFFVSPAFAGTDAGYVKLAKPQPVTTGKKIELTEFFWYRCPHCYELEPA